ncbi:Pyridine nucleotide-disulfide oxidoreductase, FAD/NAD(P)-binding domain protein [Cordyceps fumosorosea ARSEF 2679]|uniref:Pyridine nucleotide-disulfide oxidoreductase, FAD/NAD(P)-binding domain protein n=1 Tax=Cordyceps fumosorosea (strain ARSEF 2679) TaxID=1081104 RepID=A0A167SWB7_CORFA|nr:Pyridine nucleotide-disulfide oxidoreductase, FAD/NAD(P)-binding domain protein [Cordyceps fumosorosea ARSEF 2679]OAA59995.1 Pyridine nucleotide-disulfide oxidoreductase, FAD/NAD(P)-binding domain protein [Cordyceps fumosorosea ARSEF 2679]
MRPLTLDELGEVASLVFTSDFEEDDRLIEPEAIVYSLHSLVHCDASNQRIELAHSSVRTFLTNPELSGAFYTDPAVANATISKACLYYLALPPFQQTCPDEAALGARKRAWPFFEYAACFWTRHARAMVSPLSDNDKQFLALFASFADSAGHFSAWYQCVYPQGGPSIWNTQPLYMCAREGLAGPLQVLLVRCSREELEQRGGARGSTALHVAATYGEVEAVRLLLAAGADPNERNAVVREDIDPIAVAKTWLANLVTSVAAKNDAAFSSLFFEESWWRDSVGFSWTITSKNGPEAISKLILGSEAHFENASVISAEPALAPQLVDMGPMTIVQFGYAFTTQYGHGRGIVRLGNSDGLDNWRAWTASSQLDSLREKPVNSGVNGVATPSSNDYQVLIVGAGQSGAMLSAWLGKLGVRHLVVDKATRPGDAWRDRYACIKAHTPSYGDHFALLNFPESFPTWPARDEIADWIDHYSATMGLSMLSGAAVTGIRRDAVGRRYSVDVSLHNGAEKRTYTTTHVVLATGVYPAIPVEPALPGRDTFRGQTYHTAAHTSAGTVADLAAKDVIIVGSGTSAHDVAQDFVAHGARSVTMVQRSRIWAASTSTVEQFIFSAWAEPGLDTDAADLLGTSMPLAVVLTLAAGAAPAMADNDRALLDGLEAAGMRLARGDDGVSLLDYQAVKIAGFYIDQGAGAMIVDGRIRVRYCAGGVQTFDDGGVILADGTALRADVVVLATGYKKMTATMEELLGKELASKATDPCNGLDAESERAGLTRPTGVPGLWYMAGSFMMCRQLSRLLALQIAAVERGINRTHFASASACSPL